MKTIKITQTDLKNIISDIISEQAVQQAAAAMAGASKPPVQKTPAPAQKTPAPTFSLKGQLEIDCKAKLIKTNLPKLKPEANAMIVKMYCEPQNRVQLGSGAPKPMPKI